jgi:hypothetical protein
MAPHDGNYPNIKSSIAVVDPIEILPVVKLSVQKSCLLFRRAFLNSKSFSLSIDLAPLRIPNRRGFF